MPAGLVTDNTHIQLPATRKSGCSFAFQLSVGSLVRRAPLQPMHGRDGRDADDATRRAR